MKGSIKPEKLVENRKKMARKMKKAKKCGFDTNKPAKRVSEPSDHTITGCANAIIPDRDLVHKDDLVGIWHCCKNGLKLDQKSHANALLL